MAHPHDTNTRLPASQHNPFTQSGGGQTATTGFEQIFDISADFFRQLTDPSSQFFERYRQFLNRATPSIGQNALFAPLAAGGDFGGGQFQSQQLAQSLDRKRQDTISKGVLGFGIAALGQAKGFLDISLEAARTPEELALARRRLEILAEQNSGGIGSIFGNILGTIGGAAGGSAIGGIFGGAATGAGASAGAGAAVAASDINLKENIKTVGKSPSGIDIVEFNYKNQSERFRGVIAQDIQDKYPNAVVNKDRYLAVDYSKIDVSFERI